METCRVFKILLSTFASNTSPSLVAMDVPTRLLDRCHCPTVERGPSIIGGDREDEWIVAGVVSVESQRCLESFAFRRC